jgi:cytochrome c biogenesis protein CcmG/thiol:disulfide interchange protein DsbE
MTATELPPEDRAPVRPPRRVSRGLLVAAVLATVVLAIATIMAFRPADEDAATLDPNALAQSPLSPADLEAAEDLRGDQLPDLDYETFEGNDEELTTDGQPLVVNFWYSNCAPCVKEMPAIEEVHRELGDQVRILGLQVFEAADLGLAMIARTGVTYDVGRDPSGTIVQAIGTTYMPTTVFIAANGTIAEVHAGELTADELRALIDEHLVGT